jgi:hypothetical protein
MWYLNSNTSLWFHLVHPKVIDVRTFNSIFEIAKVDFSSITDLKERKKARFINRFSKEIILNYLDIAAFYGTCKNQILNAFLN